MNQSLVGRWVHGPESSFSLIRHASLRNYDVLRAWLGQWKEQRFAGYLPEYKQWGHRVGIGRKRQAYASNPFTSLCISNYRVVHLKNFGIYIIPQ